MHFLRLCQPIWVCNALRDVNVREQSASLHHECVVGQPSEDALALDARSTTNRQVT
eukprot:COSAG01_NODE_816_length_13389_cov_7.068849_3_plen_56_part_00